MLTFLARKGLLIAVGLMFFFYSYKNSIKLFDWIEDQTFGTRDFILQKCELLHVEIEPRNVTYILLFLSFGLGVLVFGAFALSWQDWNRGDDGCDCERYWMENSKANYE